MELKKIFKIALAVIDRKTFSPVLATLYYNHESKEFVMTDSITMVIIPYDLKVDKSFMIDYDNLAHIEKICNDKFEVSEFTFIDSQICFDSKFNWKYIFMEPKDLKYPEYQKIIPTKQETMKQLSIGDKMKKIYKVKSIIKTPFIEFDIMENSIAIHKSSDITILHRLPKP